jgi:hypothetical protein
MIRKRKIQNYISITLIVASVLMILPGIQDVSGIEFYSKDEKPLGKSASEWLAEWWTWWITKTPNEVPPKPGGCLINNSSSMVMLMETTVSGAPKQICKISANQSIIIPAWVAFMEKSTPEFQDYTHEQLAKAAREMFNLGAVTSIIKVDNKQVAELNEVSSMRGGQLDYTITKMDNFTEVYSTPFNITIPENTHIPDQNIGTWPAASHGWVAFLKPLPPGEHELYYNVRVAGVGPNAHSAEITYTFQVK